MVEEYGEATSSRFACGSTLHKCEKGTQRRKGRRGRRGLRGGLYGGVDDNTTACRCLVLLLLSQRQLPSASVFDRQEGKDTELMHVVARSAKWNVGRETVK